MFLKKKEKNEDSTSINSIYARNLCYCLQTS